MYEDPLPPKKPALVRFRFRLLAIPHFIFMLNGVLWYLTTHWGWSWPWLLYMELSFILSVSHCFEVVKDE